MCENYPVKKIWEISAEAGGEGRAPGPGGGCVRAREAAGESVAVATGRLVYFLRRSRGDSQIITRQAVKRCQEQHSAPFGYWQDTQLLGAKWK